MPRMSENERNDIKSSILEIMSASMTRLHINKAELAEKCGITKSTMYARWQILDGNEERQAVRQLREVR